MIDEPSLVADPAAPERAAQAERRRAACYDLLTGLPNRLLFREQLGLMLRLARRNGSALAVMLADVDDFRRIRHTLGHECSEEFLHAVARRLESCLRSSDIVAHSTALERASGLARLYGNEFAVLLNQLAQPRDAELVAQRLRAAMGTPVRLEGVEIFPALSIGIALFPGDGDDADTLLHNADIALGLAKERGKDQVQFYRDHMNRMAASRLELEASLRHALDGDEFVLAYQPRVDLRSGQVLGAEALLRWQHPTLGLLAPGSFIEVAEQTRLIVPIGQQVLQMACAQNRRWQRAGLPPMPVGVNVSALQVGRPDFAQVVREALAQTGLEPRWLELEVTESMLMHDTAAALRSIGAIKALGVRVAIDDFGTGFSSLTQLRDFPFDVVKIDRSFVERLPEDRRTGAITEAVIRLGGALGMEVVAEGVETPAQAASLLAQGCHLAQGYLYARPGTPEALEAMLRAPALAA